MLYISIHAPREGGDQEMALASEAVDVFQSTPPARGATNYTSLFIVCRVFQSTPPARGATKFPRSQLGLAVISIHAPREGGDAEYDPIENYNRLISIHAPREGGDVASVAVEHIISISIHAPREGGDLIKI